MWNCINTFTSTLTPNHYSYWWWRILTSFYHACQIALSHTHTHHQQVLYFSLTGALTVSPHSLQRFCFFYSAGAYTSLPFTLLPDSFTKAVFLCTWEARMEPVTRRNKMIQLEAGRFKHKTFTKDKWWFISGKTHLKCIKQRTICYVSLVLFFAVSKLLNLALLHNLEPFLIFLFCFS